MIGTHQVCLRPVGAGTTLSSDNIVHIPHEQAMVFGITADGFRCCCRTRIDGIRASTPPLPETFIGTGRGSQKNGDVRKTVAQQFHKFIHLIVVHIYIITPIMAFIGSERENQQFGFQGSDFGNTFRMSKCKAGRSVDAFIYIRDCTESFCQTGTSGLRVDMSTYMTVANMNDADCIFGESGTHLAEMFKDGS